MNQCSPSQIILSEMRVHVTHTVTHHMRQKTFLTWYSSLRQARIVINGKRRREKT